MAEVTKERIEEAIKGYIEPHMEKNLVDAKCVKGVDIDGNAIKIKVELGFPARGFIDDIAAQVKDRVEAVEGVNSAEVEIGWKVVAHSVQKSLKPIDNVKNIIAVASGKGGLASPPPRSIWPWP